MTHHEEQLTRDVENIRNIPVIDTILEVVCQFTGMGFAAVARVTKEKWIACSVRDEINFGLKAGGELKVNTTICSEIRESSTTVVIDEVSKDPDYYDHPTPKMYGFESYISVPIFFKSGDFFGTLCAIDPAPAKLDNPKTIGMFRLFAELISFHLESIETAERSAHTIQELNRDLRDSKDEVKQYQFISNHNLQEPLRKMRFFVSMLRKDEVYYDRKTLNDTVDKVAFAAENFSNLIMSMDNFSSGGIVYEKYETVDLNVVLLEVMAKLRLTITEKEAVIRHDALPVIKAIPQQMQLLFYQLISNSLKFARPGTAPVIRIVSSMIPAGRLPGSSFVQKDKDYTEIIISDNGTGIADSDRSKLFTIFTRQDARGFVQSSGIGLAQCRKIMRMHRGEISLMSGTAEGASFRILLPIEQ